MGMINLNPLDENNEPEPPDYSYIPTVQETMDSIEKAVEEVNLEDNSPEAKLKALREKITREATKLLPLEKDAEAASEEERKALELLNAARMKRNAAILAKQEAERQKRLLEQELKSLQWEIEEAARLAEQERLAEIARKEATMQMAELGKRFDNATAGAPWREWAKEHQLFAGKLIARNRRVILADAMGLGKTLSSIITTDMTYGVTKEVTPDFPMLGEEKEIWVPQKVVWTQQAVDAGIKEEWPFDLENGGGLTSQFNKIPALTPFDDPMMRVGSSVLKAGNQIPYLAYDIKMKLGQQGFIETKQSYTKTEIVNSITRPVGRKILYFCPAPLLRNVLEEWRNWSPGRSATFIGAMSKAERQFALSYLPKLDEYVIIVNYEAWRRDLALLDELGKCQFDTIIIDEAHNIKDMKSQAFRGVQQVVNTCQPEYLIPMTGTPLLNRPQEFFTLLHLINPQKWYSEKDYLLQYCEEYYPKDIDGNDQYTNPKWKFRPGGWEALEAQITKNYLRRTKDDAGIVLPEKVIIHHDIAVDPENYPLQAKARKDMKELATLIIDSKKGQVLQATVMIALITRLRQIETWPAGIIQRDAKTKEIILQLDIQESQKIDYAIHFNKEDNEWDGLIPQHIEDERMVVFSQFKAPLHELKRRIELMGKKAVIIDGDTPQSLRDEARLDFDRRHTPNRADARWDIALCNYKAAGVGLNLTAATNMVVLDSEWNPGKRDQAFDRLHRIGQTENVTINVLSTTGTIDSWLDQMMIDKEAVVSGAETSSISANDLKNALDSGLI